MTQKESFIKMQTEKFPGAAQDVLKFICDIFYYNKSSAGIVEFFSSGYCYYFAVMLQNAFGGKIMWVKGKSHIVWVDTRQHNNPDEYDLNTDIAYDIYGVYVDYEDLVPVENLMADLESFRHRGHDFDVQYDIIEYQREHNLNDYEINEMLFNIIPENDRTFDYPNAGDTYRYWSKFKRIQDRNINISTDISSTNTTALKRER